MRRFAARGSGSADNRYTRLMASIEFTGPDAELADIRHAMSQFAQHGVARIAKGMAGTALELVQREQAESVDPDDIPWEPTKRGNFPVLTKTGTMRTSWRAFFGPAMFGLSNPTAYVQFHQTGTVYMPQRRLVPDDNQSLPVRWFAELEATQDAIFDSFFDGLPK